PSPADAKPPAPPAPADAATPPPPDPASALLPVLEVELGVPANALHAGDLDGDGKLEALVLCSVGRGRYATVLVAVDDDGRELWRAPNAARWSAPLVLPGSRPQVVFNQGQEYRNHLAWVDGASGKTLRTAKAPGRRPVHPTRLPERNALIAVAQGIQGRDPHDGKAYPGGHRDPRSTLGLFLPEWRPLLARGDVAPGRGMSGVHAWSFDADGDGRPELLWAINRRFLLIDMDSGRPRRIFPSEPVPGAQHQWAAVSPSGTAAVLTFASEARPFRTRAICLERGGVRWNRSYEGFTRANHPYAVQWQDEDRLLLQGSQGGFDSIAPGRALLVDGRTGEELKRVDSEGPLSPGPVLPSGAVVVGQRTGALALYDRALRLRTSWQPSKETLAGPRWLLAGDERRLWCIRQGRRTLVALALRASAEDSPHGPSLHRPRSG
ncbi:MAG: hypothetical protein D6731_20500, partial [Planctomycetota bacterium]